MRPCRFEILAEDILPTCPSPTTRPSLRLCMACRQFSSWLSVVHCRLWVDWCTYLQVDRQCLVMGLRQQLAQWILTMLLTCLLARHSL